MVKLGFKDLIKIFSKTIFKNNWIYFFILKFEIEWFDSFSIQKN